MNKLIVVTAPSGSGKTSIVKFLIKNCSPPLSFSISATSRPARMNEKHGKDYYFLSLQEFKKHIKRGLFVEYREVYPRQYYGTLRSEIERIWKLNHHILFDVDVDGASLIKDKYPEQTFVLFIKTAKPHDLQTRLESRGTETIEAMKDRSKRIAYELEMGQKIMDGSVVNINLEKAQEEALEYVENFLNS
ncbi:MAG: guanylate kinase [Flavobacteriaceae bacterium]|nr:guanylate kinase [Flavobacteriaceae bacterium]